MDQGSGVSVLQHPERPIGGLFHIADAMADVSAFSQFGAAVAVKDDAVEGHRRQATDETAARPLRECLRARVEHQIAWRDLTLVHSLRRGEPHARCEFGRDLKRRSAATANRVSGLRGTDLAARLVASVAVSTLGRPVPPRDRSRDEWRSATRVRQSDMLYRMNLIRPHRRAALRIVCVTVCLAAAWTSIAIGQAPAAPASQSTPTK